MKYRFYDLDTEIRFGKFEGMSLQQILERQPSYVVWCLKNLDHFLIDETSISDIEKRFPGFSLSDSDRRSLELKWKDASQDSNAEVHREIADDFSHFDSHSYDEFEGSYASDDMGYSDDYIRIAFDGEPGAYWNID